ncbi:MAG: hypothetical protein ABEJ95_06795 [Candidatus Nanohalobium sp.]
MGGEFSLEDRVFDVAGDYGLDIAGELDGVRERYLGTYVNARTGMRGSDLLIDFDPHNFSGKSGREQRRIILHELIHPDHVRRPRPRERSEQDRGGITF